MDSTTIDNIIDADVEAWSKGQGSTWSDDDGEDYYDDEEDDWGDVQEGIDSIEYVQI